MSKKSFKVYVCGVDFQHEIGNASDGNTIYPSVAALKAHAKCWKGCGIVELNLTLSKWVVEQNYEEMCKNSVTPDQMTKNQIKDTKKQIEGLKAFLKRLQKEKP